MFSSINTSSPITRNRKRFMEQPFQLEIAISNSQNDVRWGDPAPKLDTSIPTIYEVDESPVVHKKKKMITENLNGRTPVRVFKRHASSPAMTGSKSVSKIDEKTKNLRTLFEDDDDISWSQALTNVKNDPLDNSIDDDILAHIPLEEISKECSRGAKSVDLKYDYLAGSSQIVRGEAPKRNFERCNSLPVTSTTQQKSPEDLTTKRICTVAEIERKKQEAMAKLKRNKNVMLPAAKTNLSHSGEL